MVTLKGEAKQRYVADLFSGIASRYDLMNDLITAGQHRRWKKETALLAAKDLPAGLPRRILDVATGTGDLALTLGQWAGVERVVGVDLLPDMVRLARSKSIARGLPGRVAFAVGDALALPFPDGVFAGCTAGFSLRNMPNTGESGNSGHSGDGGTDGIQGALAEMARVVAPGGRVVTLELTPMSQTLGARWLQWYFHRVVPWIGHFVAGNRAAYTYLPQSVSNFPDAGRLLAMFEGAGLSSVGFKTMGFGAVALHWGRKPDA